MVRRVLKKEKKRKEKEKLTAKLSKNRAIKPSAPNKVTSQKYLIITLTLSACLSFCLSQLNMSSHNNPKQLPGKTSAFIFIYLFIVF